MTLIRTVPLEQANGRLRQALEAQMGLYPKEYSQPSDGAGEKDGGIVGSHSLIPAALEHAFSTFGALMSPELPLSRRHHEMIATMVSVTNRCVY